MNNYREFDAYALSSDPSFRRWVLDASAGDTAFWADWLRQNPDRATTVDQARAFIVAVQRQYRSPIGAEEIAAGVERIVAQTHGGAIAGPIIRPLNSRRLAWGRWAAAAGLVLTAGLGWQTLRTRSDAESTGTGQTIQSASFWIDRANVTTQTQTILLTDGSVVTLERGSRLRYPRRFDAQQRAVTLTGEAFFEVARRPQQPFVVTTDDFTTTVLGTSFRVRSSSPQHQAFVVVQSGKVAVLARNRAGYPTMAALPVVLTRNQQVVVKEARQPLVKTPVQDADLTTNDVNREQVFEDVAVATVFEALEGQYGIAIQYDRAVLSRCLVNTSFGQENLRERLSAVCQAVGATYRITDDQIIISSSGCTL